MSGVIRGFMPIRLDMPKSVTFARLPSTISRTLLLERSLDDVVRVKVGQGECNIMTDVELGVVREGTSGPL